MSIRLPEYQLDLDWNWDWEGVNKERERLREFLEDIGDLHHLVELRLRMSFLKVEELHFSGNDQCSLTLVMYMCHVKTCT